LFRLFYVAPETTARFSYFVINVETCHPRGYFNVPNLETSVRIIPDFARRGRKKNSTVGVLQAVEVRWA